LTGCALLTPTGNFSLDGLLGFDVATKTVGVIGTGTIRDDIRTGGGAFVRVKIIFRWMRMLHLGK
jgi:lactate dehydrogenase-like 2-hydroxyacid dehydrogenase